MASRFFKIAAIWLDWILKLVQKFTWNFKNASRLWQFDLIESWNWLKNSLEIPKWLEDSSRFCQFGFTESWNWLKNSLETSKNASRCFKFLQDWGNLTWLNLEISQKIQLKLQKILQDWLRLVEIGRDWLRLVKIETVWAFGLIKKNEKWPRWAKTSQDIPKMSSDALVTRHILFVNVNLSI